MVITLQPNDSRSFYEMVMHTRMKLTSVQLSNLLDLIREERINNKKSLMKAIINKIKEWGWRKGQPALLMSINYRKILSEVNEKVPGPRMNIKEFEYEPYEYGS